MSSREINYDPARIRFELAGPDNDKELLEILCEVFQRQFTRAWHEWFAYGSPHGQTRYYLARDLHSGQIVATYGLMPLKVKLGNAIVKGALSVNTGARMIWRGTGLFQELGRYALRTDGQTLGTVISLGVPNRFSHNALQRIGWEHVGDLVYLARSEMPIEKTDAQQVDLFTSEIDQMIKEAISDDRLAVSKDHVWLNWRYARPDQHYTRYQLQLGSELAGYVVLKRFFDHERHDEKVHIVDLRAANPEAFRHLVRAAYGFAQGVGELNTWAFEGTSFYGALHQMGFRQTEELRHLIVYRHGLGTPVELSATRNWNFMMGDTDVF